MGCAHNIKKIIGGAALIWVRAAGPGSGDAPLRVFSPGAKLGDQRRVVAT